MYTLNKEQISKLVKKLQSSKAPIAFINRQEEFRPIDNIKIGSLY